MRMGYEVRSGKREVAFQYASTPQEALIEYLRSIGCRDDEVVRLGARAVSWRGAVFTAAPR
ncbi:MAG: hypothetical protein E6G28_04120 [Actinobacteria bacterium]|nr:MAG: hypothetical protein E6G28_04120 [Actinomycetota bacterium]